MWRTSAGTGTLRGIARRVADAFDPPIRHLADPASYQLARRIVSWFSH